MDKKQRRDKEFYLYKKRLKNWAGNLSAVIDREGELRYDMKLIDLLNERVQYKLKHTSTLCSCYGCSGYYKYRRYEKKMEDRKLLEEYNEDI